MTTTILPTRNEAWGFYGTMRTVGADAATAWEIASRRIAEETQASPEGVRDFLDSRYGRHFADDVIGDFAAGVQLKGAIEAAIARWQGWRINRADEREHGIPRGLPYLTGWATHFAIMDETGNGLPY
jgi:hypothetical protein